MKLAAVFARYDGLKAYHADITNHAISRTCASESIDDCLCVCACVYFAGIRILVTFLLDTIPMLGNALLLSFLIFFVFGIISVQLWQGKLRNRCFTTFTEDSAFFTR